MTHETLLHFLGWCAVMNIVILMFWAAMIMLAPNLFYTVQTMFIKIPQEKFNIIHYKAMAYYKILIFVFNIVPYLALRVVG